MEEQAFHVEDAVVVAFAVVVKEEVSYAFAPGNMLLLSRAEAVLRTL